MLLVRCQRRRAAVAAVDLRQPVRRVVFERDLGRQRPFAGGRRVAAQQRRAPQLVLPLPAEHAPLGLAGAPADDRGGQAVVVVAGHAAVGRALASARESGGETQLLRSEADNI